MLRWKISELYAEIQRRRLVRNRRLHWLFHSKRFLFSDSFFFTAWKRGSIVFFVSLGVSIVASVVPATTGELTEWFVAVACCFDQLDRQIM